MIKGCVPFFPRYDPVRKKRLKTVELIIAARDWQPPESHPKGNESGRSQPKTLLYKTPRPPYRFWGIRIAKTDQGRWRPVGSQGTVMVCAGRGSPQVGVNSEGRKNMKGANGRGRFLHVVPGYYGY